MKKIMFNDRYGLTQAVIEGRKTMTRRIVPTKTRLRRALAVIHDEPHGSEQEEYLKSACYKVGEIVAVAQNYRSCGNYHVPNVPRELGSVGQTDQVEKGGRGTTRPHAAQIDASDELHLRRVHERISEKCKRSEKARGGVKSAIP